MHLIKCPKRRNTNVNTTRTIEITAKSEDEARQLANGELNENETIVSAETLSAPAKGIFGFVGKQEFKMKFTIEHSVPEAETHDSQDTQQSDDNTDDYYDYDDDDDYMSENDEQEETAYTHSNDRETKEERPERHHAPERERLEVTQNIKSHPKYDLIFELITEASKNLGLDDIQTQDYIRDGAWVIEADGENLSQLIGKRGRTLDSLQYLMNIIFNKGCEERFKIVLDAQGYREKRYRNLISLANRMTRKVISSRRSVELEPMSTLDRRTVHLALKDKRGIQTFSKGVEPSRRVVIAPSKKRRGWKPSPERRHNEAPRHNSQPDQPVEVGSSVPMFMEEDV